MGCGASNADRELLISTRGLVDEQAAQIKALKTTVDMLVKDSQNMADSLAASTELASKRFAVLELRQTDDTKNTSVKLETLVAQHRQAKEEAELGRARLRQKIDETSAKASVLQHLVESNAVALEHERHTREQAHLALAAAGADLLTDKPPGTAGAGGGAGSALHDAPTKTRVRLAVLGRAGVGKSSLIRRFTRNEFGEEHVPTLKATHARSIAVDGHRVDVEILDTAGIASPDLTKMWMEHSDGLIFVYDIADRKTFQDLPSFVTAMLAVKQQREIEDRTADSLETRKKDPNYLSPRIPIMIVGNKEDLSAKRQVTSEEGRIFGARILQYYIETSAKTGLNVNHAFQRLASYVLQAHSTTENPALKASAAVSAVSSGGGGGGGGLSAPGADVLPGSVLSSPKRTGRRDRDSTVPAFNGSDLAAAAASSASPKLTHTSRRTATTTAGPASPDPSAPGSGGGSGGGGGFDPLSVRSATMQAKSPIVTAGRRFRPDIYEEKLSPRDRDDPAAGSSSAPAVQRVSSVAGQQQAAASAAASGAPPRTATLNRPRG